MSDISITSKGWLAFFGLIQCVLVSIFATALGFSLTIGNPSKLSAELTRGTSRTAVTRTINATLSQGAREGGLMLPAGTQLLTAEEAAGLVKQTVAASADFQTQVDLKQPLDLAQRRLQAAAAASRLKPSAAQWRVINPAMKARLTREVTALMRTGLGAAYGMSVLVLQTITIVTAILMVINVGLMGVTAHSLKRWLRVNGRILYVIGFLGGIGTLVAGSPALSAGWQIAESPVGVVSQLLQAFAPTWQRVAGLVVVSGLVLAGLAYVFRKQTNDYKVNL